MPGCFFCAIAAAHSHRHTHAHTTTLTMNARGQPSVFSLMPAISFSIVALASCTTELAMLSGCGDRKRRFCCVDGWLLWRELGALYVTGL